MIAILRTRLNLIWLLIIGGYFVNRLVEAMLASHALLSPRVAFLIVSLPEITLWLLALIAVALILWPDGQNKLSLETRQLMWWLIPILTMITVSSISHQLSLRQLVIGFRGGYVWLLAFSFLVLPPEKQANQFDYHKTTSWLLGIVLTLVAAEFTFGPGYLERWHLISPSLQFGYGWFFAGRVPQLTLAIGSNQLGLLVGLLGLVCLQRQPKRDLYIAALVGAAIALTGSRSAILATLVGALTAIVLDKAAWRPRLAALVGIVAGWLTASWLLVLFYLSSWREVLLHGASTSLHAATIQDVLRLWSSLPWPDKLLGLGLGTATYTPYVRLLPENFYLAILIEIGLFGLISLLGLLVVLLVHLAKTNQTRFLLVPWSAFLVANLFLQPFSDNKTAALWLVGLSALLLALPNSARYGEKRT